jgi:MoaA/NifB/PqqE/SkfB family radical SAM enzyme
LSGDAYSPIKALRHLDVLGAVKERRPARPVHVQIILSDLCNQACGFCAYRDPNYSSSQLFRVLEPGTKGLRKAGLEQYNFNPSRMIAYDKAIEIIDDCADMGVEAVQFTGGGEPTVHPQWEEIAWHAIHRGLAISLVTNGVQLGKRSNRIHGTPAQLASWVRVSLDAATVETYTRIRNVPAWHFRAACDTVRGHAATMKRPGRNNGVIGVGFVVTPDNWHEILDAAKLAKSLGADNIRIGAQFSADGAALFEGFYAEAAALAKAAEALTDERFTVYNRLGEKLADLRLAAPDYESCGYQQFTTYIGADLNVYRCCVLAYNERGIVGSLKGQRFRDLWMSQERADGMVAFKATGCELCQFNSINRVLDYATREQPPLHAEFV